MNRFMTALLFTGFTIFGAGACGEAVEEAKELYDCGAICTSYGECIEETGVDYDQIACTKQCEEKSDKSMANKRKAEACQDCIEMAENTCVNKAFTCAKECADVVMQAGAEGMDAGTEDMDAGAAGTDAGTTGTDGGTDGSGGADGT